MNTRKNIVIGTRGSKLALYQANLVKAQLEDAYPEQTFELKVISTKGDRVLDKPLAAIGDKGLFTQELEEQLLSGDIDMAVHSLKDLPTQFPEALKIGAILKRADSRDAIVSSSNLTLNMLTRSHTIATSSLRRKASLLNLNPDLNIVDIRGNVDTRIRKMKEGYCDAIVMAAAGLERLELTEYISEYLDKETLIPAPGQGAIAVEIASANTEVENLLKAISDKESTLSVLAERSYLNRLQGGCQIPIGCFSKISNDRIELTGFVSTTDGSHFIRESYSSSLHDPAETGFRLAEIIIHKGGQQILDNLKS